MNDGLCAGGNGFKVNFVVSAKFRLYHMCLCFVCVANRDLHTKYLHSRRAIYDGACMYQGTASRSNQRAVCAAAAAERHSIEIFSI